MINEQDLLDYGFEENEDFPLCPFEKRISEPHEGSGRLSIVVTHERNQGEFALKMPDGSTLFLQVENLEQLEDFEKSIQSWEPNY